MGCVIGHQAKSERISQKKVDGESKKKKNVVEIEIENGVRDKYGGYADDDRVQVQQPSQGGESRRRSKANPRLSNPPKHLHGEQVAAGWPPWLTAVCGEALSGWIPRKADTFEKIDKIGQGTYSNVYKAKDSLTGKIVALKKVRFDNLEPESIKFMAREILILRRLDHPNVIKLQGLVTSRMSCSLYLVFDYMEHDLAGLAASPVIRFTESQVRPDLWSAGCILGELLAGKPIMPGRTEFFTTEPYACDPSSLPKYPPSKEMDVKRRDDEMRRQRTGSKAQIDGSKKHRIREFVVKAMPAPEANAELQSNIDRRRLVSHANAKSKSEKFPPPHKDGQLGFPLGSLHHIDPDTIPTDVSFISTTYTYSKEPFQAWSGPISNAADIGVPKRKKHTAGEVWDLSKPQKGASKDTFKGKGIIV
ncbi:hypothetical protein TSUD_345720 [Trifolium subterraneum]|nr:hypothetical protein TSUD_345720 [Trifolium subterraneum]